MSLVAATFESFTFLLLTQRSDDIFFYTDFSRAVSCRWITVDDVCCYAELK